MAARQPEDRPKGGRAERLAAALKQNLKRRKAQARGRSASGPEVPAAERAEDPKANQER
jgi:hypothetical protein